jgi:4-hydroxyphenylpyruvate dioxygenase
MPENPLRIKRIHHIEFWTGNARQAAFFYRKGFGFSQVAYQGLETGERRQTSYVLAQGKATLVFTTPMDAAHPANDHLRKHGDGVRDIALHVEDTDCAFREAVRRGALPAEEPHEASDEQGAIRRAAVHTYGDTLHSFISYKNYTGPFLPGFAAARAPGGDAGLLRIDHVVGNVELGQMERWAEYYSRVFGFHRFMSFDDKDISTEYSALMSIVMADDSDAVKFPINEPAPGRGKSQIDEYLEANGGPGVQHIAFQCRDALQSVRQVQDNGVEFLRVPDSYYDTLLDRVGKVEEPLKALRSMGILVDRDEDGYLLQIFTIPLQDRPTLFFEIIQRKGSEGFGKGNFKALFEAIEREQARRGNL